MKVRLERERATPVYILFIYSVEAFIAGSQHFGSEIISMKYFEEVLRAVHTLTLDSL